MCDGTRQISCYAGARSGINGKILEAVHGEVYLSSSQRFLKSSREEPLVSRGIQGEMLELVPLSLDDLELDLKGREVLEESIAYHLALAQCELASSRPEDEGLRSHVMGAYLVYG